MAHDTESALEVLRRLPDFRRNRLILRVESVGTEVSDWYYQASYPELQDFSVSAPDVLSAILELESKLDQCLDTDGDAE
jgi:hypothetical protein